MIYKLTYDNHEHYFTSKDDHPSRKFFFDGYVSEEASKFVRKLNIGCPYKQRGERSISLQLHQPFAEDGTMRWRLIKTVVCTLPHTPPTREEYEEELEKIVSELPIKLQDFVKGEAYERGHSSGYEEVLNEARILVGKLQ